MGLFLGTELGAANGANPVYDPAAVSYFAAMSVQPTAARKTKISDLIAGLKSDGVWSLLDALYLTAAHDSQAGLINAKTPASIATLGGTVQPAFTVDRGFTGNIAGLGYIDSGIADNAAGNWTQDSASLFCWINVAPSGSCPFVGFVTNANTRINGSPTVSSSRIHAAGGAATGATASSLGLSLTSRSSSTLTTLYRNGVSDATSSSASVAPLTDNFAAFRNAGSYGDPRISAWGWGGSLDAALQLSFYARLNAYLTAIGGN